MFPFTPHFDFEIMIKKSLTSFPSYYSKAGKGPREPLSRAGRKEKIDKQKKKTNRSSFFFTLPLMATHASPSRWCAATCSIVSFPSFLAGGGGAADLAFSTAACSELEERNSAMMLKPKPRSDVGDDGVDDGDDNADVLLFSVSPV